MTAQVMELDPLGKRILDEFARGTGNEDLPSMGRRANARCSVDPNPDVAMLADLRLGGVNSDPYPHVRVVGPRASRQAPLQVDRGSYRVARAGEGGEEGVALRVYLPAAGGSKCVAETAIVFG